MVSFALVCSRTELTIPVPCLRRAATVNYTDADEDAEKLMSFLDEQDEAPGPDDKKRDDDEWVTTHIGRGERCVHWCHGANASGSLHHR